MYVTFPTFTYDRVKTVKIIMIIWIKMVNKDIRNLFRLDLYEIIWMDNAEGLLLSEIGANRNSSQIHHSYSLNLVSQLVVNIEKLVEEFQPLKAFPSQEL